MLLEKIKSKVTPRKRAFVVAFFIVLVCSGLWLFGTNTGYLARTSFTKTFDRDREKVITVYAADGTPIRTYRGKYVLESWRGHYSIIDVKNEERIDIYGNSSVLVDEDLDRSADEQ